MLSSARKMSGESSVLVDSRTRPDSRSGLLSESSSVNCLIELSITESGSLSRSRHPWTRSQGPKAALLNQAAAQCRLMHSARRNPWAVSNPPRQCCDRLAMKPSPNLPSAWPSKGTNLKACKRSPRGHHGSTRRISPFLSRRLTFPSVHAEWRSPVCLLTALYVHRASDGAYLDVDGRGVSTKLRRRHQKTAPTASTRISLSI